jgi:hypothetical protein
MSLIFSALEAKSYSGKEVALKPLLLLYNFCHSRKKLTAVSPFKSPFRDKHFRSGLRIRYSLAYISVTYLGLHWPVAPPRDAPRFHGKKSKNFFFGQSDWPCGLFGLVFVMSEFIQFSVFSFKFVYSILEESFYSE